LAAGLWKGFGTQEQAIRALTPLIRGTLDNIEEIGIPDCLTGPISRGDVETIEKHISVIKESVPQTLDLYRLLGLKTIPIAAAKGSIDAAKAAELKEILEAKL